MGLSPGENPVTYRDREIIRKLMPLYEQAIKREAVTLAPQGAAAIREAMDWHADRAAVAEARPYAHRFTGNHVEMTDGRRTIGVDDVLRPF